MTIPDDLRVDIRGGKLKLWTATKWVELELDGRHGVFANGPMMWTDIVTRYVLPALAQFNNDHHAKPA